MISCMQHSRAQHVAVSMHHSAHASQHPAVMLHHLARAFQHPAAVLLLRTGNLHTKDGLVDCTLVACKARHPAAHLAIRTVTTTVIGTFLRLSMSNHTVQHKAICSSCCLA